VHVGLVDRGGRQRPAPVQGATRPRPVLSVLVYLIPIALFLGLLGLGAFLWSLKSGQYEDLDGAAERILFDDDDDEDDAERVKDRKPRSRADPPAA
jgi:cbb3-type cytochrome oxidase maturation protein